MLVLYPLAGVLFRLRWRHLDRIPAQGGVLIAINHVSQADTAATARMVWQAGRIPRFLIKSGVFSWPLVGLVMRGAGQIPVHRGTADARQSLEEANSALSRGECVIIYPEGTITSDPDYWPMTGRTGVARIALDNPSIPLYPVGQWGAQQTLARGGRFRPIPRHTHSASVGPALNLSRFVGHEHTADLLREVTDLIMSAITAEVASVRNEAAPRKP
ncbi:1-acyl-sn-glycerol-3-phosphate acyltransferase [Jatrophihabitans telluris]|uniref:1-acyl-sn-glycerol-3-phosphate acyltransferase n=1 Tax=Jatrophihabitans telluris TaxID=2038343 RepID=A0ABY4QZA7_9ACTN|nr:lysophospholipid acyltransferase family protein [Jatrophihabitans telluris]UQX88953.1 1-acyl-sn-glycerol-3-phosphate acyltransferase [Jatrophihabitans telluris]